MPAKGAAEFFKAIDKYPVTHALKETFTARNFVLSLGKSYETNARIDIVSPELCKDSLSYIRGTLDQYKGCDVIDINPGIGLWSQHIHEALKPRCHLLMEPEPRYFDHYVKPLLDQPGSTYRHSNRFPTHAVRYWDSYQKIFEDGSLPDRQKPPPGDPSLRQMNRTLLITGNVHRTLKLPSISNSANRDRLTLNHMIQSAQTNTMFHAYGLIKMLFWLPCDVRPLLFPEHLMRRSGPCMTIEMGSDITELVTSSTPKRDPRTKAAAQPNPFSFHQVATLRAADQGRTMDYSIPRDRISAKDADVLARESEIREKLAELNLTEGWNDVLSISELTAEVDALHEQIQSYRDDLRGKKGKKWRSMSALMVEPSTKENERILTTNLYEPFEMPTRNHFAGLMKVSAMQVKAEAHLSGARHNLTPEEASNIEERLLKSASQIREAAVGPGTHQWVLWSVRYTHLFNEQLALFQDPPNLINFRQPCLPLWAKEDEFWPRVPCMLLEIDPLERNFASDITSTAEGASVMRALVLAMFSYKTRTVRDALEATAVGAGEDVYEGVPELKDIRKGGRLDPKDLRACQLNRYLLDKIVAWFLEWPFRPSSAELASNVEEDASEDEVGASRAKEEDIVAEVEADLD